MDVLKFPDNPGAPQQNQRKRMDGIVVLKITLLSFKNAQKSAKIHFALLTVHDPTS